MAGQKADSKVVDWATLRAATLGEKMVDRWAMSLVVYWADKRVAWMVVRWVALKDSMMAVSWATMKVG